MRSRSELTPEEYRKRILEIERYYDARASWSHPERMYLPYVRDCIEFLTSVVEADFYHVDRPQPTSPWTARALERWEKQWF